MLEPSSEAAADQLCGLSGLSRTLRQEWPNHDVVTWSLPAGERVTGWADLVTTALGTDLSDAVLTRQGAAIQAIHQAPRLSRAVVEASNVCLGPGRAGRPTLL